MSDNLNSQELDRILIMVEFYRMRGPQAPSKRDSDRKLAFKVAKLKVSIEECTENELFGYEMEVTK